MAESKEDLKEEKTGKEYIDVSSGRGHTRIYISTGKVILNNFIGGLAWGFGTVLGATVVVGLVVIILSKLNSIPFLGDFFSNILQDIQQPIMK